MSIAAGVSSKHPVLHLYTLTCNCIHFQFQHHSGILRLSKYANSETRKGSYLLCCQLRTLHRCEHLLVKIKVWIFCPILLQLICLMTSDFINSVKVCVYIYMLQKLSKEFRKLESLSGTQVNCFQRM